jgi:hypothetical protein
MRLPEKQPGIVRDLETLASGRPGIETWGTIDTQRALISPNFGIEPAGCCGATVCVNIPGVGPVCHCAGVESPWC